MSDVIINRVTESGLITLDLEEFYPKNDIAIFDIKDYLFMNLILKEKDFRAALISKDWSEFENKNVSVYCSIDAIIPVWAYMLVASYLEPLCKEIVFGDKEKLIETILLKNIQSINGGEYLDKRVVVKGCGEIKIPEAAYVSATVVLRPFTKSIMYGEPCSTVPIFKKK